MTRFPTSLPPDCDLRPAAETDMWAIRRLVLSAKLDPTQLRWPQFWVVTAAGKLIACGQLRNFRHAQELGSLVVISDWRGQGIGTYLTQHLIAQATQPLYLECLGHQLAQFYHRFGFMPVTWQQLPPALKRKFGLSHLAITWLHLPIVIMEYQGNKI
ncbi:MAG: GNAT family N-acetyltransferase [Cyanothece sp. SIO1E1]|nr:GNAT family N-acetyltransferase [Cyanothece sp. SIO1E1]